MDILFYNGEINTLDTNDSVVEAIGVKDGKIIFLGDNKDALKIECDKSVDLNGKFMLPGFIDSHLHLLNYAFIQKSFKLFNLRSIKQIKEEAKIFARKNEIKGSKWLFGRGWNESLFEEKRFITRKDLDEISTEYPIYLLRVCGHIATGNTKALQEIMNLEKTKKYMSNIDVNEGILKESAVKLCYDAMNSPSQKEVEDLIQLAAKDLNAVGITSVQSDDFLSLPGRDFQIIINAYNSLQCKKNLNVRVYEQAAFTSLRDMKKYISSGYRTGDGGEYFKIGPVKILQDGSLGAKTALLREDYTNEPGEKGIQIHSNKNLLNMIKEAHDAKMQVAVHAIGDRAVEMVIDTVEDVLKTNPRKNHRHGVVHLQITDKKLLERMKRLNMIAYIQPVFIELDMDLVEKYVGKDRMNESYAWKTMVDIGLHTAGGSDAPVSSFNILENIQIGVTRQKLIGGPENGWMPKQRLTIMDAVKMFTVKPAYSSFEEDVKGTLELGKYADMVILSDDIFKTETNRIKDIKIEKTIIGGKIVFER